MRSPHEHEQHLQRLASGLWVWQELLPETRVILAAYNDPATPWRDLEDGDPHRFVVELFPGRKSHYDNLSRHGRDKILRSLTINMHQLPDQQMEKACEEVGAVAGRTPAKMEHAKQMGRLVINGRPIEAPMAGFADLAEDARLNRAGRWGKIKHLLRGVIGGR